MVSKMGYAALRLEPALNNFIFQGKYGNDTMFIAIYKEYDKNISVFVQADGNMAEWGTVFANLATYSFGCQHRDGINEMGTYLVKRPSQDDLSKVSTQKFLAFSKMVGSQQGLIFKIKKNHQINEFRKPYEIFNGPDSGNGPGFE